MQLMRVYAVPPLLLEIISTDTSESVKSVSKSLLRETPAATYHQTPLLRIANIINPLIRLLPRFITFHLLFPLRHPTLARTNTTITNILPTAAPIILPLPRHIQLRTEPQRYSPHLLRRAITIIAIMEKGEN